MHSLKLYHSSSNIVHVSYLSCNCGFLRFRTGDEVTTTSKLDTVMSKWQNRNYSLWRTPLSHTFQVRLQVGLYIVYLMDWLSVVNREQVLVLRLEDHATNRKYTMHRVFDFLDLGEKQHILTRACNYSPRGFRSIRKQDHWRQLQLPDKEDQVLEMVRNIISTATAATMSAVATQRQA